MYTSSNQYTAEYACSTVQNGDDAGDRQDHICGERRDTPTGMGYRVGPRSRASTLLSCHGTRPRPSGAGRAGPTVGGHRRNRATPIGDVEARRVNGHRMFDYVAAQRTPATGVEVERHTVPTGDGTLLDCRLVSRTGAAGQRRAVSARRRHDLRPRAYRRDVRRCGARIRRDLWRADAGGRLPGRARAPAPHTR